MQKLEMKTEVDSVVDDMLNTSITKAMEEQEQMETKGQGLLCAANQMYGGH